MTEEHITRWAATDAPRGDDYDARWKLLAARGDAIHGEADCVSRLVDPTGSVLDGGCGTGRVAIELAARYYDVVGVDADDGMLATARSKAPELSWVHGDLATLALGRSFDAVIFAGNVMIFVDPGTEGEVLLRAAEHLRPGGLLIAGFQLRGDRIGLDVYDALCEQAGCVVRHRWASWDGGPFVGGDYAVSVHAVVQ